MRLLARETTKNQSADTVADAGLPPASSAPKRAFSFRRRRFILAAATDAALLIVVCVCRLFQAEDPAVLTWVRLGSMAVTDSSSQDELLTVAEVAELLKLNPQTVRNWI